MRCNDVGVFRSNRGMPPASGAAAALRRGALLLAAGFTAGFAGCATKRDVKDLGSEIALLRARQDSMLAALEQQHRALMDSLRTGAELVLQVRGDLGHQLLQMEQQLVQIQELTGQSQRRLSEMRQQLQERSREFQTQASGEAPSPAPTPGGGTGDAGVEQLYRIGMEKLQQGAPATARAAFQQILSEYSTHEQAPDAQFQIAETYVAEQNYDTAFREFDRVIELFPNSARAPSALFRAGVLAEERGNISKARGYFTRVRAGYPTSDEARLAADKLRSLQGR